MQQSFFLLLCVVRFFCVLSDSFPQAIAPPGLDQLVSNSPRWICTVRRARLRTLRPCCVACAWIPALEAALVGSIGNPDLAGRRSHRCPVLDRSRAELPPTVPGMFLSGSLLAAPAFCATQFFATNPATAQQPQLRISAVERASVWTNAREASRYKVCGTSLPPFTVAI